MEVVSGVGHVYNVIYGVDNGHSHATAAPGIVDIKIERTKSVTFIMIFFNGLAIHLAF